MVLLSTLINTNAVNDVGCMRPNGVHFVSQCDGKSRMTEYEINIIMNEWCNDMCDYH